MHEFSPQAEALTEWFCRHRRPLPWRQEPRDPYWVLVSEIMLQQTQVDRVVPRFEAFVERFPDFEALAAADEEQVVAAWSGLGYYRRARSLAALARRVVSDHGGSLPRTLKELRSLPGVGPYTAAAVASLAFGEREPVLDGNVLRVGARVLGISANITSKTAKESIESWTRNLVEIADPSLVNEGLMELGALVCTPSSPNCSECPFFGCCAAHRHGLTESIPTAARSQQRQAVSWIAACAIDPSGNWLLRRVDVGPILRGLWLPPFAQHSGPSSDSAALKLLPFEVTTPGQALPPLRHTITYRDITVNAITFPGTPQQTVPDGWRWAKTDDTGLATSTLLKKLATLVAGEYAENRVT